jgi:hypothetical protein
VTSAEFGCRYFSALCLRAFPCSADSYQVPTEAEKARIRTPDFTSQLKNRRTAKSGSQFQPAMLAPGSRSVSQYSNEAILKLK